MPTYYIMDPRDMAETVAPGCLAAIAACRWLTRSSWGGRTAARTGFQV
jgi:hypothetical protein